MKKNEKTIAVKSIISNGEQTMLNEATGVLETVENVTITFENDTLPYIKAGTFEDAECHSKVFPASYVLPALKRGNADLAGIADFNVAKAHGLIAGGGTITFAITEYEPGDTINDVEFKHKAYRYSIIGATLNAAAQAYIKANAESKMKAIFGF